MKRYKIIGLLLFAITFCCCKNNLLDNQIMTSEGIIEGVIKDEIRIFKGIPFAQPPVGDLRWKAPQPPEKWDGVKLTTEFAPAPKQGGNPNSSEDCLYLNVWTPAKSEKEKLPVMVWIYGGGFSFGSTSDPTHDGFNLAKKGVVLVSVAYRVAQIGFLAHPELSAENENGVSGNYGLFDMIAGLEWIQKNIEKFGGDADNVTIFGESAGGIAVSMLCGSPLTKGLFHKAISQSGGSFGPVRETTYPGENTKTLEMAEADGLAFAENLGANSIEELRKLDADMLIPKGWTTPGSWPIVDGYVIKDNQYTLYENGDYNDIPVLIGYNSDEGLSFSPGRTAEEYVENVKDRFGIYADKLLEAYPLKNGEAKRNARNLMRDAAFGWHTWSWAKLQAKTGSSQVYLYIFDKHPEYEENSPYEDFGTPHGVDVQYVFMNMDRNNQYLNDSDIEMSNIIGEYWTNFAKTGNPNSSNLPNWDKFSVENQKALNLGSEIKMIEVPDASSMEVLSEYYDWRRR